MRRLLIFCKGFFAPGKKMFPLSGAHSFLSRLSNSEDVFEKETSLESSRRLLAKVILFFYLFHPT